MGQSLVQIYVHLVFHTKKGAIHIPAHVRPELYDYFAGILKAHDSPQLAIGGTSNHVHLLLRLSKIRSISKVVEELKASSSKWLKTKDATLAQFRWQDGYGAFSIGSNLVNITKNYILNQEEHHRQQTFQQEFLQFMAEYEVFCEEKYIWD